MERFRGKSNTRLILGVLSFTQCATTHLLTFVPSLFFKCQMQRPLAQSLYALNSHSTFTSQRYSWSGAFLKIKGLNAQQPWQEEK